MESLKIEADKLKYARHIDAYDCVKILNAINETSRKDPYLCERIQVLGELASYLAKIEGILEQRQEMVKDTRSQVLQALKSDAEAYEQAVFSLEKDVKPNF